MKVISMVPSWTETLLAAGIDVVGRTRFCIHPAEAIASIPVVGGTKTIDWKAVERLGADVLLLDREENPQIMAEQSPLPVIDTHVRSILDVERDLRRLAEAFQSVRLKVLADRWQVLNHISPLPSIDITALPGVLDWVRKPSSEVRQLVYLIWKDPWMAAAPQTFIGSVLQHLGYGALHVPSGEMYPTIDLADFDPQSTVLLFSTEPFPFERRREEIVNLEFPSAIVDGEVFSWFGVRSLQFLETHLR